MHIFSSIIAFIFILIVASNGISSQYIVNSSYIYINETYDLSTAIKSSTTAGKTLLITTPQTINDLVIPSDRSIKFIKGGLINLNSGSTLLINGPFEAGLYQVFSGNGTVKFNPNSVKEVFPQYWGAIADGAHDDTYAIQSAVNSHKTICIPRGVYKISSTIAIQSGVELYGYKSSEQGQGSWIHQINPVNHLQIVGSNKNYYKHNYMHDISFTGKMGLGIRTAFTENLRIERCNFSGTAYGLQMSINAGEQDIRPWINNNIFYGNQYGIYTGDTRLGDPYVQDNLTVGCSKTAFRFGYLDGGIISNNHINSEFGVSDNDGITVTKAIFATFQGNRIFQVNGSGVIINQARYVNFLGNYVVWTGSVSRKNAVTIRGLSSSGGLSSQWNKISDNTIRESYGTGLYLDDVKYTEVNGNIIKGSGYKSIKKIHDGISLNSTADSNLSRNIIDGKSDSDSIVYTRYWLYHNNINNIKQIDNHIYNCLNGDTAYVSQGR